MYERAFWFLAFVGKPFGGVRPQRLVDWIAERAFPTVPNAADFAWYRDRYGNKLHLHPYYLIDRCVIALGTYERKTSRFIWRHLRPGMCCLDVGANIGVMSVIMGRRVGPRGRVDCFEPVPDLFDRLGRNLRENCLDGFVLPHRFALSDCQGTASIRLTEARDTNQGMGSLVSTEEKLTQRLEVQTVSLDAFVEKAGLTQVDFIKVDIQGAESLFLRGAENTLRRWKPDVLMEVSPMELAGAGETPGGLLAKLRSLGYLTYRLTSASKIGRVLDPSTIPSDFLDCAVFSTTRVPSGT